MRNINVRFEEFVIMEESLKKFFFFFHFEPAMVHFLRDIYIYTHIDVYTELDVPRQFQPIYYSCCSVGLARGLL